MTPQETADRLAYLAGRLNEAIESMPEHQPARVTVALVENALDDLAGELAGVARARGAAGRLGAKVDDEDGDDNPKEDVD